jgi:hypothetical protein
MFDIFFERANFAPQKFIMKHPILKNSALKLVVFFTGLSLVCGCRTVPQDSLASFSTGLTTAKSQSTDTFKIVNDLIADASIDYAAKQPTLTESSFAAGLDDASILVWEQALGELEQYAEYLQSLTSPALAKQFEDESINLSSELMAFGDHLGKSKAPEISPSLAAGFTELGQLIIRLKGQTAALKVLAESDSEIRHILFTMSDSIGYSCTNGMRGTVNAHWNQLLAAKKLEFISQSDISKRLAIAADFRDLMQRRATQDIVLVSLRQSLMNLAALHHALAHGESMDARTYGASIVEEMKHTKELSARFQEALGSKTK